MAGFENDVMYAKNADFTQADNQAPTEANGLVTNGQLWIGSTSTNAGGTHINVGTLTSPGGSVTIGYSSPNITLESTASTAKVFTAYILNTTSDNLTGDGTFVTVPFDSLFYDSTGGFNTGTSTFTAPTTGYWNFNLNVFPYRLGGTNTVCIMDFYINGTTAYRTYEVNYENTQITGELVLNGSFQINLTAGDTVIVRCGVGGASKNIGFGGTAALTRFSGQFLGT